MKQFKLTTIDGEEIIAYEKPALKAYYRSKNELIDLINDEDAELEEGSVLLEIRNVDDETGKEGEWIVYQEYSPYFEGEEDENPEDIDENSVDTGDEDIDDD